MFIDSTSYRWQREECGLIDSPEDIPYSIGLLFSRFLAYSATDLSGFIEIYPAED
jgi:hypothetical protein